MVLAIHNQMYFLKREYIHIHKMRNLVSIDDLDDQEVKDILSLARRFKEKNPDTIRFFTPRRTLSVLFMEPSTRTILSFQKAMYNLGGNVLSLDLSASSTQKGETLSDTLRTVECYSDIIVIRHPGEGSLRDLSLRVPVINAGDGAGEHPTQSLLDLFTIVEKKGRMNGLTVLFVGDNENSRTVHSLVRLLERFGNECILFDTSTSTEADLEMLLARVDVVYLTRHQKERRATSIAYTTIRFDTRMVNRMREDAILMHPLPRNDELPPEVDDDKRCVYFDQVENGVFVRMAILAILINVHEQSRNISM